MDIILTTKSLIQSHDEFGVASDIALKNVLSIKTCHFHKVVLTTSCYIKKGYQKGSGNPI